MQLIDTHCHLDDARLTPVLDDVYHRALKAGVVQQVIPAVSAASWQGVKELCERYAGLHPCYGLHPHFLNQHQHRHVEQLRQWLSTEHAVAVGECGLDFFLPDLNKSQQQHFFTEQLKIADEFELPVVLHANRAVEEVINCLKKSTVRKGVVHSFNGSQQQAEQLITLGFKLSFGGAISYTRAIKLRGLAKSLPLECIMIETDAPDQPPASQQGKLNQPCFLIEVFNTLCSLRGESKAQLAKQLNSNAVELFSLTPL
jgi:TatD DNase family protein